MWFSEDSEEEKKRKKMPSQDEMIDKYDDGKLIQIYRGDKKLWSVQNAMFLQC